MTAELPPARVVVGKHAPALAPAPRRVPPQLWLELVFGQRVVAACWATIAFFGLAAVIATRSTAVRILLGCLALPFCLMLVVAAVAAARALHLLRHGRETTGKLVAKERKSEDDWDYYELTFEYVVGGVAHRLVVRASEPRELEDDLAEPMIYDVDRPQRAAMMDALPGRPAIVDGKLESRRPTATATLSLLLAACVVGGVVVSALH